MAERRYVKVLAGFREDGIVMPVQIWWEGEPYAIEGVRGPVPAAAQKAGGCGDRYTIQVKGKQRYLFFERSAELAGNKIG